MLLTPVFAQNLIPNGDFEQGIDTSTNTFLYILSYDCVINVNPIVVGCDYWTAEGESDRFVYGSPFFNCYDNIISHSGTSHIEFNGNDGAYTTLINSIIAGHKYKLEYFVCLDSLWFAYWMQQGGFSPQTGIIFTFNNGGNTFNSPLITYTGYGDWRKYDTIFTAQANSTEFKFHGNNQSPLPIYIDDISLQEDTSTSIKENSFNCISFIIILNPDNNILSVTINDNLKHTIIIFNSLGQVIFHTIMIKEITEIPMVNQNSGIYYISIYSKNSIFTKKIILNKNI